MEYCNPPSGRVQFHMLKLREFSINIYNFFLWLHAFETEQLRQNNAGNNSLSVTVMLHCGKLLTDLFVTRFVSLGSKIQHVQIAARVVIPATMLCSLQQYNIFARQVTDKNVALVA